MSFLSSTGKNKQYWENRRIDWTQAYFTPNHPHRDFIMKLLKPTPPRSVLEIGCGAGANLYRIKKEWPDCRICGCDISADAIKTADETFKREFSEEHFYRPSVAHIADIDFRVGDITKIPFNGEFFDLVITDACLIYVGKDEISRAMKEIRRVGYDKFMFCEFHSESRLKRMGLRMASRYFAYNYFDLLSHYNFKYIKAIKLPPELFGGEPWTTFGNIICSIR